MAREKSWQHLIEVAKLETGDVTPVEFQGRELAVFDGKDGISVAFARCTHGNANLCNGYFDGRNIECPLHQGLFDSVSGAALAAPARVPLRMIKSRVVTHSVQVFW